MPSWKFYPTTTSHFEQKHQKKLPVDSRWCAVCATFKSRMWWGVIRLFPWQGHTAFFPGMVLESLFGRPARHLSILIFGVLWLFLVCQHCSQAAGALFSPLSIRLSGQFIMPRKKLYYPRVTRDAYPFLFSPAFLEYKEKRPWNCNALFLSVFYSL